MPTVFLKGWEEGFLKVSFTKLQMAMLQLPIREAKTNTDKLLDGEEISLKIEDSKIVRKFVEKAMEIGVICTLEAD